MKKILLVANHAKYVYNLRKEIIEALIDESYQIGICCPWGKEIDYFTSKGCLFFDSSLDRHGKNPFNELKLLREYGKIVKEFRPDVILTYTIKPNLYVGIVSRIKKIPLIANITGLGTSMEKKSSLQTILVWVYKIAFKNVNTVFLQNKENMQLFIDKKIAIGKHELLPGSGVNIDEFKYIKYPSQNNIEFVFISRVMKEKGIDQFLEAAKAIKELNPDSVFHICGFCEDSYENKLNEYHEKGIVNYHGMIDDVKPILAKTHCIVHPTFYPEGMSNVLLEAGASGRPIITTDRSGCREIVVENENGYLVPEKDYAALIAAIKHFLLLSNEQRASMGRFSRDFVSQHFDREIIVNKYLDVVRSIMEK